MSESNGTAVKPDTNVIAENTIVFVVRIRMIGNSKGIATKHAAKRKKGVTASKSLLDCPEYEALTQKSNEIRGHMRKRFSVPNCDALLLQNSAFPVPLDMVEEADTWLQRACREFNSLHKILISVYEKRKLESFEALKQEKLELNDTELSVISLNDFKSLEQVRCDIGIDYRLVSFGTPTKLQDINDNLWRRETDKIKSAASQAMDDTVSALREMVRKSLDHLIESLTSGGDGAKKKSIKGPVEKAKELFDQIKSLNVTGDRELNAWSEKCREILSGADVEILRDSNATRRMTAKLLEQVKKSVDASIVKAPSREILYDE